MITVVINVTKSLFNTYYPVHP